MPSASPLTAFFARYAGFNYDPEQSSAKELRRLIKHQKWHSKDSRLHAARNQYKDALTKQFNKQYGTNAHNLKAWKKLCKRIGISPVPNDLAECRTAVKNTHVNLVDLVNNGHVQSFDTVQELSAYTQETNKYFPRSNIHAGDLLKHLLRQIHGSHSASKRSHTAKAKSAIDLATVSALDWSDVQTKDEFGEVDWSTQW